jgi:tetratricopeptide (TPR) repeat protein
MGKRIQTKHRPGETYAGIAFTALLVALVALPSGMGKAGPAAALDHQQLEEAILGQDWEKVISLLPKELEPNLPAPLRLVKGHACLATNRNNESLALFLNSSSDDDLRQWEQWTQAFLAKYPTNHIAHYFAGDAAARVEKWENAMADFNKALQMQPNDTLALNARGTTYCAMGQWDGALTDLNKAVIANKQFADAHTSLGAMWIQRRAGQSGALQSFHRALKLSPDFVLARNGRGCAEFASGDWEKANKTFAQIGSDLKGLPRVWAIVDYNLKILALAAKKAQFPFFCRHDFIHWNAVCTVLADTHSVLHVYFQQIEISQEITDAIVQRFNELLEVPNFYDQHTQQIDQIIDKYPDEKAMKQIRQAIIETSGARTKEFAALNEEHKERIRKMNRMIIECLLRDDVIQVAMNDIDSPGFSLERGVGFVDSWSFKQKLSNDRLMAGNNHMQDIYRPMADTLAAMPIVGGIGNMWNRHLDNQLRINSDILGSRGIRSPSGGVDFNLRKARLDNGDWGVGTWFGLAYHVESRKFETLTQETNQ